MNDILGLLLFIDANLADHWPDIVLFACFPAIGWLIVHLVSALEARVVAVEAANRDLEKRVTVMEAVAKERERVREK